MHNIHKEVKYKNCIYIYTNQHRSLQNSDKSLWTISEVDELNCFQLMYDNNWICDTYSGWSLHKVRSSNEYLGKSQPPKSEQVKIAKFVDSSKNSKWHGFPVDYRNSLNDRPKASILTKWVENRDITKPQMSKILRGKICYL
ncbi:hypothetical protein Q9R23_11715 [Exiguobacterium sp. BRG2]|uniref:hypothetical protein n=1 Tax=Exiguobacterium sp. BRG2 TaxID=2962584 RepID=UPI002881E2D6|nr:hypothetical protein [Exiguobacterium sp. BRG2]MDT0173640.1 hypothetical protein [Exiguobacterium sp. BRG2]